MAAAVKHAIKRRRSTRAPSSFTGPVSRSRTRVSMLRLVRGTGAKRPGAFRSWASPRSFGRAGLSSSAAPPPEDPRASHEAEAEDAARAAKMAKRNKRKRKQDPLEPPPPASDFPSWAYDKRDYFGYELVYKSKISNARVGRIHTPHGIINTPGFVPVATNGALKAVDHRAADEAGCELMFMNTYHLLLQPGPDVIDAMGGLHKFSNRSRPIITDSGGFQVFSLSYGSVNDELNMKSRKGGKHGWQNTVVKIREEGADFRSYRDGALIHLSPESSVLAQKAYRSDIIVPLDELPPYHITKERLTASVFLSHRWEARSLKQHLADLRQQAMYCVVGLPHHTAMRHQAEHRAAGAHTDGQMDRRTDRPTDRQGSKGSVAHTAG